MWFVGEIHSTQKKKKHKAELPRTASGTKVSCLKFAYAPPPPPPHPYGWKYKFHQKCRDTVLKIISTKYSCVTCSSFTDRKYLKNTQKYLKKAIKCSKIKMSKWYWKVSCYRSKPKDHIFKTLGSYARNYLGHEKNDNLVKNCPQIVKNEKVKKHFDLALSVP